MSLFDYDVYFAGNALFEVYCTNNLVVRYELENSYCYRITKKNDVFYCHGIKGKNYFYLCKIDYFSCNLILPSTSLCAKYKKELMVIEKLLFHSKEEDVFLLENNFTVHPLNCFYCGKKTINPKDRKSTRLNSSH